MGAPGGATMSIPRCQPMRRRPKLELTPPSTGHANRGTGSLNSGIARIRFAGIRGAFRGVATAEARRVDPADDRSRRTVAAGDRSDGEGIEMRVPRRSRPRSSLRPFARMIDATVTPYLFAIPDRVWP